MRIITVALAALAAGLFFTSVALAKPPGPPVPVETLLRDSRALRNWLTRRQPELRAASARVMAARAEVGADSRLPNPTLDASVSGAIGRRNPPGLPWSDTIAYSVGLSETIELGKRGPRIRAAELRRSAATQAYRGELTNQLAAARSALARVVYLGARQHILDERLAAASAMANLDKTRLTQGDVSGIDHDRLVLDAAAVEREAADNRAAYQDALADCDAILLASCTPGSTNMNSVDQAAPVPDPLPDANAAAARRADVRALDLAGAAASEDARYWRHHALPDPTLGVTYTRDYLQYAGDQPYSLAFSLSLPLPIFDHGQYQARRADAEANELHLSARALEQRARASVASLVAQRHILQQKLARLQKDSLPRSSTVLHATEEAYRHGEVSMTDLILARREREAVVLDAIDTRFALFTTRSELRRVLGVDAGSSPGGQP